MSGVLGTRSLNGGDGNHTYHWAVLDLVYNNLRARMGSRVHDAEEQQTL